VLGRPRLHHRLTASTNERAKELAAAGAPHGTLVTADEQSAGRGRQGRVWTAPPGSSILASLVLREFDELLPLVASVAVAEACEAAGVNCAIKWPNDVWIDGRKVAGILVEGRPQEGWAVLGFGLNVSTKADELPEELKEIATSLQIAAKRAPSREALLETVLAALEGRLADSHETMLAAWAERDALKGRAVSWEGGEGIGAGVDEDGALLVDTDDGRVALDAGEVHLKGTPP
jgi:BirA family transcriptional regulator, biotin operon repressor / biotin---[acetyl-CoA-carboxylase] ligase